jgi:hypothetical protein
MENSIVSFKPPIIRELGLCLHLLPFFFFNLPIWYLVPLSGKPDQQAGEKKRQKLLESLTDP